MKSGYVVVYYYYQDKSLALNMNIMDSMEEVVESLEGDYVEIILDSPVREDKGIEGIVMSGTVNDWGGGGIAYFEVFKRDWLNAS